MTVELAPSLVGRAAFTSLSSSWCYVEIVEGKFEKMAGENDMYWSENYRFEANEVCPKEGFYFTPAHYSSRRFFSCGEVFPEISSEYGKSIWQWDAKQN